MSLVAYEGSEESENEDEQEDNSGKVELVVKDSRNGHAFFNLPAPKQSTETIKEVEDEFLAKKENPVEKPKPQKIKIGVPSLAQFDTDDEDDEAEKTKTKKTVKESGLFALLPPPKGTPLSNKSFIPNVLTRKPPPSQKRTKPAPKKPQTNGELESDDEMDAVEAFDEKTWQEVCAPKKKPQKRTLMEADTFVQSSEIVIAPEAPKPYDGLDNEAFKKLVGGSKRRRENIKLIDVNEDEVLTDKDLWLTKALTDPNMVPKEEVEEEEEVNNTCKKKHHITYLAQQAKANEQELQNQWSQSKYNRRLTQSKYGF